jgi:hypothetical protein
MKGGGIQQGKNGHMQEKIMWENEQGNGLCHKLSSAFTWPVKNK